MDELLKTTHEIDVLLERAGEFNLSDHHFQSQMMSYVIGNAFDVFPDPKTVTIKSVKSSEQNRRSIFK